MALDTSNQPRIDLIAVADLVREGARVLDVGCGEGELLELLRERKNVDGRGVELSQAGVNACVARGLSVVQGDADRDLGDYPDDSFDYVILSQTIQATRNPREVLGQMKRIGRRVVVSFPNFGHWKIRLQLLLSGRMPVTRTLADEWYDTPNIHLCTVRDFLDLCEAENLAIEKALMLAGDTSWTEHNPGTRANLRAEQAVFLLYRK
ncbi:methionine biosynthesis protein MetW [Tepidicaulis sp.]|jgi:methionine biosynthesis protein MetW|uniref:methionine biosynthesis protein MetW n=1 Tax=Tepidicaulis sp. TaxID=1920809 RepID=UPI003B5943E5